MKTAAVARLSAEAVPITGNDNRVQYEIEPNAHSIDSIVETELAVGNTINNLLQVVQEPGNETSAQVKTGPHHGLFSTVKKLFAVLRIPGQRYIDHLIKQQYKNAVDNSDSLNLENINVLISQEREAELEKLERFRISGM